jgi:hypothetical protein
MHAMRVSAAIADLFGACCKSEEITLLCVHLERFESSFSQICYLPTPRRFRVCRIIVKSQLVWLGVAHCVAGKVSGTDKLYLVEELVASSRIPARFSLLLFPGANGSNVCWIPALL